MQTFWGEELSDHLASLPPEERERMTMARISQKGQEIRHRHTIVGIVSAVALAVVVGVATYFS